MMENSTYLDVCTENASRRRQPPRVCFCLFLQLLSAILRQGQAPCYCHPIIMAEVHPLSEIQSLVPLWTTYSDLACSEKGVMG